MAGRFGVIVITSRRRWVGAGGFGRFRSGETEPPTLDPEPGDVRYRPGMSSDLSLGCSCGGLRGRLLGASPGVGTRIVCYCDDCQAFAHYLERGPEILDASGGTDIFQTSPARVEIVEGELACMRLTPKGMLRWSSACCRSPIGNTMPTPALPFVGLITASLGDEAAALGPVRGRVMTEFATGPVDPENAHPRQSFGLAAPLFGRILMSRLRGEHRRSPFFDPDSGKPVAKPHVLDEDERRVLSRTGDSG